VLAHSDPGRCELRIPAFACVREESRDRLRIPRPGAQKLLGTLADAQAFRISWRSGSRLGRLRAIFKCGLISRLVAEIIVGYGEILETGS
jgi:hypothetical protein